ncbi:hypothetical protein [Lelliottia wanjuensis]|uniref:hypothetical protein n=1 Tax=Lelliottia wanjuensis TaxID=3050585 RepID=UPI00254B3B46|nr:MULTISPECIES: hypothetical protein [unclassified Lelliottia]MDK9356975.1 hypothetical protein [Lelliottia sp. V106_16]MDK9372353.1 hypothetical protein [Lelliottia sp. V106_10]MDK9585682.1 hypothetical protein [Lelliottia sp. V86_10]MDK9599157.1 hypothetical protein [Lelliottia sp. V106_5]
MTKKILRRIYLLTNSFILTVVFFFKACLSRENLANGNKNFIISMTTFGWRYNFVFLTIESILSQDTKPSNIYLWVYKDDKPSFVAKWFLTRQLNRGLVIKYVDRDVRSYKKLSYVLSDTDCNFKYVVTADDDVFYPKKWLRSFVENPNVSSHILCNRGRVITFKQSSEAPVIYKEWPLASTSDNLNNCILPTGVSGISYPLAALDARISDFDAIENLCPYADDIWYKLLTTANGYNSLIIDDKVIHFTPVITSLTKGLEKLNVNGDLNTTQFTNSLKYFNLKKNAFEVSNYKL